MVLIGTICSPLMSAASNGTYFSSRPLYSRAGQWQASNIPTTGYWQTIAISSDGKYQATASDDGLEYPLGIWLSDNYGSTFKMSSAPDFFVFYSICSDSSGAHLAASASENGLWLSYDYGKSWSISTTVGFGEKVVSDSTGAHLVALRDDAISLSKNYGVTWSNSNAPSVDWYALASDATGKYIAAVVQNASPIYLSSDRGFSWFETTPNSNDIWTSVATNGALVAITADNGYIWLSPDFGHSWSAVLTVNQPWRGIAMDDSGTYLAAVSVQGGSKGSIYLSSDSGSTWTNTTGVVPLLANWHCVAISSSSGSYISVGSSDVGVYVGYEIFTSPSPASTPTNSPSPTFTPTNHAAKAHGAVWFSGSTIYGFFLWFSGIIWFFSVVFSQ